MSLPEPQTLRRATRAGLAAASVLALSACGSSSHKAATNPATTAATTPPTATTPGASTPTATVGCRSVAAPAPKPAQHLPRPTLNLDPARHYTAVLSTSCGEIDIALDVGRAPRTSASFAYLARRGFFDSLTFHRIVRGFVIQGGDPQGTGAGGPGYTVVEAPPAGLRYTRGVVAMAKTATEPAGASGSQFYIVTGADAGLPPQYALLGRVVKGDAVLTAIEGVPTGGPENSTPQRPIVISKVSIVGG